MEDVNKNRVLYKKIRCIYENVAEGDINEFTNLFFVEDKIYKKIDEDRNETVKETKKRYWENRKKYLKIKWISPKDELIKSRLFKKEYEKYPFSRLEINGKKIFKDVNEFLEVDIENFCKRINEFNYIKKSFNPKNTKYRYIYVYNSVEEDRERIDYYKIDYLKALNNNRTEINVSPSKSKSHLKMELYEGTISIYSDKIILIFQNIDDYISAIFNTNFTNDKTEYLVGVGIAIADINQKVPIAKKVILSKEKIKDYNKLYFILNETEIIRADENSYNFGKNHTNFNINHLKKYSGKIEDLNSLFQNLLQYQCYNLFCSQLAFKEFLAVNKIFQKLKNGQSYFVNNRERVLNILVNSQPYENYKELYIVMPTYKSDNLFEQTSSKALKLQKRLIELSLKIKIEIVFVIDDCKKDFNLEFKNFLENANKNINIFFALKEIIQDKVDSIDFIFTDKKSFSISKKLRVNNSIFYISTQNVTLDEHKIMYRKILNRSLSYEDFQERTICINKPNSILGKLIGKWYLYLYGSQKFWIGDVNIHKDNSVVLTTKNGEGGEGTIIYRTNQSIILLEDARTKQLLNIVFENYHYALNRAFLVKVMGKKFNSNLEIFTIGIMTRHTIDLKNIQEILGDVDEVRLVEQESIQKRLNQYLINKFYF